MERWRGEEVEKWRSGEVERWRGGEVERWRGGEVERDRGAEGQRGREGERERGSDYLYTYRTEIKWCREWLNEERKRSVVHSLQDKLFPRVGLVRTPELVHYDL